MDANNTALKSRMHILIVKCGALGDVVRTSYFAQSLKRKYGSCLRLSWLTAPVALPLLRFNPWIDDLWTSFEDASPFVFDRIFSLDDERHTLEGVSVLRAEKITGAYLDDRGNPFYSEDAASWFDMGLLSRFGKTRADELKKENRQTHSAIFRKIFEVDSVVPEFYGNLNMQAWAKEWVSTAGANVGINPFAGERWPAKGIRREQLSSLIARLLEFFESLGRPISITLIGAGEDLRTNKELAFLAEDNRVRAADTDDSVLRLAALVGELDYLITSDSLAMHLAIAQRIPFLAFFCPTSAAEIDDFGFGRKVTSLAPDYCSYRKDADNSSITADRLLQVLWDHVSTFRRTELSCIA